jgi:hypothetical protein
MSNGELAERDYYRTPARLNVKLGPDTDEGRRAMALDIELWQMQSGLESRANRIFEDLPVPEDSKPLLDVIRWLDYKLDLVLYHLRDKELNRYFPDRTVTTDVSGSGLGLSGELSYREGDNILVSLTLPDSPARPIYICGQVVRSTAKEDARQVGMAVKFVEINELDRERLIRFNFRQQRRSLAQRVPEEMP